MCVFTIFLTSTIETFAVFTRRSVECMEADKLSRSEGTMREAIEKRLSSWAEEGRTSDSEEKHGIKSDTSRDAISRILIQGRFHRRQVAHNSRSLP